MAVRAPRAAAPQRPPLTRYGNRRGRTYTNIGCDDRNQFDLWRAMPGGLDQLARNIEALHAAGVRVLMPYNPWDTGTRREPLPDNATLAKLLKQVNGDGFNGDTMGTIPESFYQASADVGHPLALEPEGGGDAVRAPRPVALRVATQPHTDVSMCRTELVELGHHGVGLLEVPDGAGGRSMEAPGSAQDHQRVRPVGDEPHGCAAARAGARASLTPHIR